MRGSSVCVSGSPKRDVKLDHVRTLRRPHQPAVDYTDVLFALGQKTAQQRREDALADAVVEIVGESVGRRVRAHAAGVRAGVTVAGSLVIAGRADRHERPSVAEREDADLASFKAFLEHDVGAAAGNSSVAIPIAENGACRLDVGRNDHALAGGKTVGFHDDRAVPLLERLICGFQRMYDGCMRGWNSVTFHESLRKDLARFEPAARTIRTEDRNAGIAKTIADAGRNCRFRPENREVNPVRGATFD